jgi:Double sensory domain of two-component sensor kinase
MLPLQFFGQNVHFAINLFAAMVFFAVFWLYFDAWLSREHRWTKDFLKWPGFLLLSLSFVAAASTIEHSSFGTSLSGNGLETLTTILAFLGFLVIIISQLVDPLQKVPDLAKFDTELVPGQSKKSGVKAKKSGVKAKKTHAVVVTKVFGLVFVLPVAALAIAGLFWRRATSGLERHLKPVALGFFVLFFYELVALSHQLRTSANPQTVSLVRSFGPLWILEQILLLTSVVILGSWVWKYLVKRFTSQLFMAFTTMTLGIFLATTISFTYLQMRDIQKTTLDSLETSVNVLGYALDSKKSQTRANAEAIAADSQIVAAVVAKNHEALALLTNQYLKDKKQSGLLITDGSGQVLLRAEDPERWGDSVSSDSLIRRAVVGDTASSVSTKQSALAPIVYINTTHPIKTTDGTIVGTVTVSLLTDSSFVDGIKNSTGLDSSIYAGNVLSATTFVGADGKSRQVGIVQSNKIVKTGVLMQGKTYKGQLNILNRSYLAVYAPLKDADNEIVGMIFVGKPQSTILEAAGRSIQLTFIIASLLLVLSVIPAYLVSRYISKQLD